MRHAVLLFAIFAVCLLSACGSRLDAGAVKVQIDRAETILADADAAASELAVAVSEIREAINEAEGIGDLDLVADLEQYLETAQRLLGERTEIKAAAQDTIDRLRPVLADIEAQGDDGAGETLQTLGVFATEAGGLAATFGPPGIGQTIGLALGGLGTVLGGIGAAIARQRRRQLEEVVVATERAKDANGNILLADRAVKQQVKASMSPKTRRVVDDIRDRAATA